MIVLNLKLLIFALLATMVAVAAAAAWLARRRTAAATGALHGEQPLLTVLEDAPFGLLILESDWLRYANPYAQRLLRLAMPEGALPDADWRPLLDDDRSAAREDLAQPPPKAVAGRYRNITFASGKTARWWVTPWGARDFVFLLDITAQQRTEHAARALVNDLAHELRTPIATLLTHLEILGLDDVGAGLQRQSIALSRDEAQRMARLINDMLELGRLETAPELPRRPLDLLALVEEAVLQSTPRAAEQHLALSLEAVAPLPLVSGDADRLRQVFLNLLDNALKYAQAGNQVTVSLQRADGGVACAVCDTGPGIPPEHLPHVIRRFYRAAPKSIEGSGLGLALVAEILRRHESKLVVESPVAEGRGTCVRFVLPVA